MRKFWKDISTSVFFLISSVILIISEFTPWINHLYSPWYLYQNGTEAVYIYIFPLISSSIVVVLAIILLFNHIIKLKKAIISIIAFIAQSLNTLFLIVIFTENGIEINSYNYGVFLGISGFAILFWGLFWILIQESRETIQKA
ncbi:MAG: hypothetical protein EU530_11150 [Promethearchaeota archaeon]|nr:MAG: hypothetical protein EU530_11150 [Candidatus Lokiarchaeota archaeon]